MGLALSHETGEGSVTVTLRCDAAVAKRPLPSLLAQPWADTEEQATARVGHKSDDRTMSWHSLSGW